MVGTEKNATDINNAAALSRSILTPKGWSWQEKHGFVQGRAFSPDSRTIYIAGQASVDDKGNPIICLSTLACLKADAIRARSVRHARRSAVVLAAQARTSVLIGVQDSLLRMTLTRVSSRLLPPERSRC